MLKMRSSKIFATAKSVAQATKLSALMLGGAATVAAVSVLVGASGARALDFNFSFFGNQGTTGTTTGRIYGLIDNATGPATAVEIFKNPVSTSYNGIYPILDLNQFTVTSGTITAANFMATRENINGTWNNGDRFYHIQLNFGSGQNYVGYGGGVEASFNFGGFGGATYTAAASAEVPFDFDPAFGAALGLPLFIGLRYLKKRVASKKLKYNPTLPVS